MTQPVLHRITFIGGVDLFSSHLLLDPSLARSLEGELKFFTQNLTPGAGQIRSLAVYEDVVDCLSGKAFELLNEISERISGCAIDEETDAPGTLHAFLEKAIQFDDAADQAEDPALLTTWNMVFVRDQEDDEPIIYDQNIVAPKSLDEISEDWLKRLSKWMSEEDYASAITYGDRARRKIPHASIQPALEELANQMSAAGLISHPWVEMLHQGLPVAHAQTRLTKTPERDPGINPDRRPRSRP